MPACIWQNFKDDDDDDNNNDNDDDDDNNNNNNNNNNNDNDNDDDASLVFVLVMLHFLTKRSCCGCVYVCMMIINEEDVALIYVQNLSHSSMKKDVQRSDWTLLSQAPIRTQEAGC